MMGRRNQRNRAAAWTAGIAIGLTLVMVGLGVPCGGDEDDTDSPGTGDDPGTGGPGVGTAVGPGGGTVDLGDITLVIPPGALSEPVQFSISEVSDAAGPANAELMGALYSIGPDGLRFEKPVTIRLPYLPGDKPDDSIRVFTRPDDGGPTSWRALPTINVPKDGWISATTTHLSTFGPFSSPILNTVDRLFPKETRCDLLNVGPKYSFPPSIVATGYQGSCPMGRCKGGVYAGLDFLDLEIQDYEPGHKVYYVPGTYTDATGVGHPYYAYYRAALQQVAVADQNTVESLGLQNARASTRVYLPDLVGGMAAAEIRDYRDQLFAQYSSGDIRPYQFTSGGIQKIAFEWCVRQNLPEEGSVSLSGGWDEWFAMPGQAAVTYVGSDIPMALGYLRTLTDEIDEYIDRLNNVEMTGHVIARLTPVLGTTIGAIDCARTPSPLCIGEVAVDLVGDAGMLIGFGAPVKLRGMAKVVDDGAVLARKLEYVSLSGDFALGVNALASGNWVEAISRVVSGGISGASIIAIRKRADRTGFDFEDSGLTTTNTDCPEKLPNLDTAKREVDSVAGGTCGITPDKAPPALSDTIYPVSLEADNIAARTDGSLTAAEIEADGLSSSALFESYGPREFYRGMQVEQRDGKYVVFATKPVAISGTTLQDNHWVEDTLAAAQDWAVSPGGTTFTPGTPIVLKVRQIEKAEAHKYLKPANFDVQVIEDGHIAPGRWELHQDVHLPEVVDSAWVQGAGGGWSPIPLSSVNWICSP